MVLKVEHNVSNVLLGMIVVHNYMVCSHWPPVQVSDDHEDGLAQPLFSSPPQPHPAEP